MQRAVIRPRGTAPGSGLAASEGGATARDPANDFWYTSIGGFGGGHIRVTSETVQSIPEVQACLRVLAEDVAALPLHIYQRGADNARESAEEHPAARLLRNPSPHMSAFELRAQMTWDLGLYRNAFAEIRATADARSALGELVRLDPSTIEIDPGKGAGDHVYLVHEGKGAGPRPIMPENMWHLRLAPLTGNNLLGRSLVKDAESTFRRALSLLDYATRFFENDATPGGVVEVAGRFTPEQAVEFKDKWQHQFAGRNRHRVAVLDSGAKFNPIRGENDKAQFNETMAAVALQVCRLWRMPPHKIGILDRATFSNIEQQSLDYVQSTLLPILVCWEQAINRALIIGPGRDRFYARHNVAGLLRGDLKSRYEAFFQGRQGGWLSADDVRAMEDMNPLPGGIGQRYLEPVNMVPAGSERMPRQDAAAAIDGWVRDRRALELVPVSAPSDAGRAPGAVHTDDGGDDAG